MKATLPPTTRLTTPRRDVCVRASSPDVDVAIVGGGPAGLATALALARSAPNLKVAVLERAREMKPIGFTIGLMGEWVGGLEKRGGDVAQCVGQASTPLFPPWARRISLPPAVKHRR